MKSFVFKTFYASILIRDRDGFRVGDGFRVRVRDRISMRAKGWLGFMYYGLKLLELKLRSGGGFRKKQNHAENHSKTPNLLPNAAKCTLRAQGILN